MVGVFVIFTLAFKWIGSSSVIDLIYTLVGYTYGPLLGLYAFGMLTKHKPRSRFVPFIAILSPVLCYLLDTFTVNHFEYKFGYELLCSTVSSPSQDCGLHRDITNHLLKANTQTNIKNAYSHKCHCKYFLRTV